MEPPLQSADTCRQNHQNPHAAFKKVFGLDTHIDVISHHGGTDPLIAVKVMMHHGIPKEQVSGMHRVSLMRV